jgi:hypothetical protein
MADCKPKEVSRSNSQVVMSASAASGAVELVAETCHIWVTVHIAVSTQKEM